MIKSILTLLIVSGLSGTIFGTFSVHAADVKVTWTEPSKYRDIYSGNQGKKRFRESTFKELEKHLLKLAKALPESQKLEIDVTDVDLAGDVNSSSMRDIRVIKEIYFPRIKFSYKLINEELAIIQSGDVNIKDMNFMMGISSRYRNKSLGYEKKLLDDWFKDQFVDNMKQ
jgi:hypothetical protein